MCKKKGLDMTMRKYYVNDNPKRRKRDPTLSANEEILSFIVYVEKIKKTSTT